MFAVCASLASFAIWRRSSARKDGSLPGAWTAARIARELVVRAAYVL